MTKKVSKSFTERAYGSARVRSGMTTVDELSSLLDDARAFVKTFFPDRQFDVSYFGMEGAMVSVSSGRIYLDANLAADTGLTYWERANLMKGLLIDEVGHLLYPPMDDDDLYEMLPSEGLNQSHFRLVRGLLNLVEDVHNVVLLTEKFRGLRPLNAQTTDFYIGDTDHRLELYEQDPSGVNAISALISVAKHWRSVPHLVELEQLRELVSLAPTVEKNWKRGQLACTIAKLIIDIDKAYQTRKLELEQLKSDELPDAGDEGDDEDDENDEQKGTADDEVSGMTTGSDRGSDGDESDGVSSETDESGDADEADESDEVDEADERDEVDEVGERDEADEADEADEVVESDEAEKPWAERSELAKKSQAAVDSASTLASDPILDNGGTPELSSRGLGRLGMNTAAEIEKQQGAVRETRETRDDLKCTIVRNPKHVGSGQVVPLSNAGALAHVLAAQLKLKADSLDSYTPGFTRGQLRPRDAWKVAAGSAKPFSQKVTPSKPSVEVAIVVDFSGSMSGSQMECALRVLDVLKRAFDEAEGVESSAFGFEQRGRYNEVTVLWEHGRTASTIDFFAKEPGGGTPTLPAMKAAAEVLDRSTASAKLLVVVTDGSPTSGGSNDDIANWVNSRRDITTLQILFSEGYWSKGANLPYTVRVPSMRFQETESATAAAIQNIARTISQAVKDARSGRQRRS